MDKMLNEVTNLKLLLHDQFYNDQDIINTLISELSTNFDLFSINYEESTNTKIIQMKIKKTNMKKSNTYSHTSSYYYNILNNVFFNIYTRYSNKIAQTITTHGFRYNLTGAELIYLLNMQTIPLLYNATTLSDNIVTIFL